MLSLMTITRERQFYRIEREIGERGHLCALMGDGISIENMLDASG